MMKRTPPTPPPAAHVPTTPSARQLVSSHRWGRWPKVRRGPLAWSVLCAALFVSGVLAHAPALWLGFLLALPLMITGSGLGWRSAAALMPVGLLLAWLRLHADRGPVAVQLAGLAALLLLAILASQQLFSLWHRAARSARANERRARLLSEAALAMEAAHDAPALFAMLPPLLADILEVTHAEVFVPDGGQLRFASSWQAELPREFEIPLDSVMGRALQQGRAEYVPDTDLDPAYIGDPALPSTRSELALPLLVDGQVRAVLNMEHARVDAFDRDDHRVLEAFAHLAQEVLTRLEALAELERQRSEQSLVARITRRLLLAEGAREAAITVLTDLVPGMDMQAGAVVVLRNERLRTLAVHGALPDRLRHLLNQGLPLDGLLQKAWRSRTPILVGDAATDPRAGLPVGRSGLRAVAIVPIANASSEVQALLVLADLQGGKVWGDHEARLLEIVATSLGVVLDRATLDRQLLAMLDGVRGLARAEQPSELYHRAAASAVRLIPGAEAASIHVRGLDGFRFEAAVGFDLEALRALGPFSDADELSWYREGVEGYRRGVPRILRGQAVRELSAAYGSAGPDSRLAAARTGDIAATICVPITDSGEVVALLNVDSFSDPQAFGSSARRLAEAFAQQVGAIVRQSETLEKLKRSVVTDPLTGLGNREGFHRRLEQELARARRFEHPLSIVMLDLDTFKQVNDRFGHHRGDDVLVRVAQAIVTAGRGSDAAFRWGGDEFVLLLPELTPTEARIAAERYRSAIATVKAEGVTLSASIGIASYPDDGSDREALMRRADDLMYHGKQKPRAPDPAHDGARP